MPLVEDIPDVVEAELRAREIGSDGQLRIAIHTDIGPDNRFGEQWLVATEERLLVLARDNGQVDVRYDLPMASIQKAAADGMVGSGVLKVVTEGRPRDLLRYSNARGKEFNRAARMITHIVTKGAEAYHEEEEEERTCPKCERPLPPDTKVCPLCVNRRKTLLRLGRYALPYWKPLLLAIGLMQLGHIGDFAPPWLQRMLIDRVLIPRDPTLFAPIILGLFGLGLLSFGMGIALSGIMPKLAAVLTRDIRQELYATFQRLGVRFFDKKQVGALQTRVTQDTQALFNLLSDAIPEALWMLEMFVIVGISLFILNWRLALVAIIPGPLILLVARWFFHRIMPTFRQYWARWSRLGAVVTDSLSGIRVVKAFAQEEREVNRFAERNQSLYQTEIRRDRYFWMMWPTMGLIQGVGALAVWWLGGWQVIHGHTSLGTVSAFIAYLWMFYGSFRWVGRLNEWITRSLTACERIFEVLDTEPEVYDSDSTVPMPNMTGAVKFDNVTFGYDPNKPVLKKISLDVKPGEMIGLVGPSGAGKSTTVSLICRFYQAQEGQILVDGVDIRKISLHDLRRQIGVVLQEPFLFSGTVAENIGYAKPGATMDEIMDAAKAANAHDFIVRFPDGYDTQVGERGSRLSGGERQRISIARAILHDPKILILDEATASVDSETEKKIQEALARLVEGRTTFAIAHRLSTLRNADRLMVLEAGEQKELGTHDELLAKDGVYARLVRLQSEINQITAVGG